MNSPDAGEEVDHRENEVGLTTQCHDNDGAWLPSQPIATIVRLPVRQGRGTMVGCCVGLLARLATLFRLPLVSPSFFPSGPTMNPSTWKKLAPLISIMTILAVWGLLLGWGTWNAIDTGYNLFRALAIPGVVMLYLGIWSWLLLARAKRKPESKQESQTR